MRRRRHYDSSAVTLGVAFARRSVTQESATSSSAQTALSCTAFATGIVRATAVSVAPVLDAGRPTSSGYGDVEQ